MDTVIAQAQPQEINGYSLHYTVTLDSRSRIGSGASASVFKAVHKATGKVAAFKVVKHLPSGPRSLICRQNTGQIKQWVDGLDVDNEIAMLERLKHPHICTLYESFVEKENISMSHFIRIFGYNLNILPVLVLEYAADGDLDTLVARTRPSQ